jgi:hypothetical protein
MNRHSLRLVAPLAVAAFVFAGCFTIVPYETREGDYVRRVEPAPVQGFGSFSVGYVARADFHGDIDGIGPGSGFTTTIPLSKGILAVAAVTVLVVAVAAAAGGDGSGIDLSGIGSGPSDPTTWQSGVSDQSNEIISDLSFDFTLSRTWHDDELFDGTLDYFAFLFGVRLGGPRRYKPRYYLTGGYGYYSFGYDNRDDARVTGPYLGGGLEWFPQSNIALGLDYKIHYYFGDDEAGIPVDGAGGQLSGQVTWYW